MGILGLASFSSFARAAPGRRVSVASFREAKPSYKGRIAADELADRLALVGSLAVADREHVREAERALGWTAGEDDPNKLTGLGKRLQSDLVIGGTIEGDTVHAVLLQPQAGKLEKLDAKAAGSRPDQLAIALARKLIEREKLEVPALTLTTIEGTDGANNDKAYETYAQAREQLFARPPMYTAAIAGAQAALKLDPKMARAGALEAYARLKANDVAAASAPAKAAAEAAPGIREVRLVAARAHDYNERVDAAIAELQAVLSLAPRDAVAHTNLARLYAVKKRDQVAAAREYAAALEAEPGWALPASNLAVSQLELGRSAEAVKTLERLHQESPDDPIFALQLARAFRKADRPSAAIPLLAPLVTSKPSDVGLRVELVQAQAESGHADEAKRLLDAAPQKHVLLQTARARILLAAGDVQGAVQVLEAGRGELSAEKNAEYRRKYLRTLGVVQLKLGKPADAAKTLREVVDEDPLDAEALYDLGLALDATKDPGAGAQLAKAAKIAPYLVPLVLADGRVRLLANDAHGAVESYRAALAAGADDPRVHLGLGVALWRDGKVDDAIGELTRAADTVTDGGLQAEANYDLAEAQLAAHHVVEARAAAAKYLQLEKRPGQEARLARAHAIIK